jgi:hypothetical protein
MMLTPLVCGVVCQALKKLEDPDALMQDPEVRAFLDSSGPIAEVGEPTDPLH